MGLGLGVVVAGPSRRGLAAPLQLDVFGDHPRAFSFRRPEGDARIGLTFAEWERRFLPLGGIAGKVLSEENYFEEEDNLRFFVDYKARNPTKVVLLHYNGTGRRATDEADRFYNGHWLYYRGTRLTGGVGSSRRDRVLRVTNTSVFSMRRYRSGVADDIVIARMGAGGKPNWESAEHVGLASINSRGRTITVVRGKYGTRRGAFPKGSYVAAHVMTGPYRRNNTPQESIPLWSYNLSTVCPLDRGRRGCAEVLADYLREKLGPGGDLELFDGIVFDVLSFRARFGRPMQEVDANADGRADGGVVGGVNVMGLGTNRFLAALRERLPGRILLSDGHEPPEDARGFGLLNGIESEGYPDKYDIQLDHLSRGENVFKYWKQNSAPPPNRQFSFVNFKHKDRRPGRDRNTFVQPNLGQDRSYEKLRLSLASALFTDSAFGFGVGEVWMPPEVVWRDAPGGETRVRIFDELWQGTEQVTNWLGQPLGPAVHLAAAAPDLLGGRGESWSQQFIERFTGEGVAFSRVGSDLAASMLVRSTRRASRSLSFMLPSIDVPLRDLFVTVTLEAQPLEGFPASVPRRVDVSAAPAGATPTAAGTEFTWAGPQPFEATFYFKDVGPGPVHLRFEVEGEGAVYLRKMTARSAQNGCYREYDRGVVFANPSTRTFTFDVASQFPDDTLRRLRGSANQDPDFNDGTPLGNQLTLSPKNALFALKETSV